MYSFLTLWCLNSLWTFMAAVTVPPLVKPLRPVGIMEGDILLAGLFPIHDPGNSTNLCGDVINAERGIHRMEAMFYAIDKINEDDAVLPNITLGAAIYDTCAHETKALEGAVISVINRVHRGKSPCQGEITKQRLIAGVIGASSSSVSAQVATLLRLFQMPQISYASTSAELDDRNRFNYFLRTVPSDALQVQGLFDLVNYFKWQSVFVVYSKGSYGETAFEDFATKARNHDVCVVDAFKLTDDMNISHVLLSMLRHDTTSVVVLFCQTFDIARLLKASASLTTAGRFLWLASDSWGTRSQFIAESSWPYAEGAITLTVRTKRVPMFEKYFVELHPSNNTRNPWFHEYWKLMNRSSFRRDPSHWPHVLGQLPETNAKIDDKIPYVIDAVYAFAHALDKLYKRHCPLQDGLCHDLAEVRGEEILGAIQSATFPGSFGPANFNEHGNANHNYDIFWLNGGVYKKIGSWNGTLQMSNLTGVMSPRASFCSSKCNLGFARQARRHGTPCCYRCIECAKDEYVEGFSKCVSCGAGMTPNEMRIGCQDLPVRYLNFKWVIAVVALAIVGLSLTVFVIFIFISNNDTTVVKASVRKLSYPLLVGVLCSFALPFVIVAKPNSLTCGIRRFGVGLCFCVCYSTLLIKTVRLARIMTLKDAVKRSSRFITQQSPLLIVVGILFVHTAMLVLGLYMEPPSTRPSKTVSETRDTILLVCNVPYYDVVVSYLFNALLIVICTVFAFKTRNIPKNFNEARYIGFVMYTTCVILVAFVPVYSVGISDEHNIVAVCFNITLSATSILVGLFGPKVYIILFRPDRNPRGKTARPSQAFIQSVESDGDCDQDRESKTALALEAFSQMPDRKETNGMSGKMTSASTRSSSVAGTSVAGTSVG